MGKPAARISDFHICPKKTGDTPHVGGPVLEGASNVFIGGMPAASVGSLCECDGPPDSIVKGSQSVFIGGKPAARMGDATAHGGSIIVGCPSVFIGDSSGRQVAPLNSAPNKVSAQWRVYSGLDGGAHGSVPFALVFENKVLAQGTTAADGTISPYFNENTYQEVEIWLGKSGWSLMPETEALPSPLDEQDEGGYFNG